MPTNGKNAGLSEVACLTVLVETLIARLIQNGAGITKAELTADYNAVDANSALAVYAARKLVREQT
jgi:hypothetical protein